jgi:hypothetical protein
MSEPVAWMLLGLEDRKPKLINLQVIEHLEGTWIPLYTHPMRELSDEEILAVFDGLHAKFEQGFSCLQFARAVLKCASGNILSDNEAKD